MAFHFNIFVNLLLDCWMKYVIGVIVENTSIYIMHTFMIWNYTELNVAVYK